MHILDIISLKIRKLLLFKYIEKAKKEEKEYDKIRCQMADGNYISSFKQRS